jgi:hypothetical protein
MTHRLIEVGRCYEIKINVEKNYGNKKLKATIPSTLY